MQLSIHASLSFCLILIKTTQVLTWGVRHMKKFQLAAVNSPSIEIECGGVVLSTIKIKNAKKNPNFDTSSMLFDVVSFPLRLYFAPKNMMLRRGL